MEKKAWMTSTLFKGIPLISKRLVPRGHDFTIKLSSFNLKWEWFSCPIGAYRTCPKIWLGYVYIT